MTDCPNAEIRDRLPDLLHNRLDASTRAAVMAHVDGCADCQEELELLRGVRKAIVAGTPRVNISDIVYALPKPPAVVASRRRAPRVDWRLAAAVTVLAVGASSMTLLSSDRGGRTASGTGHAVAVPLAGPAAGTTGSAARTTGLSSRAGATVPNSPGVAARTPADVAEIASTPAQAQVDAASAVRLAGLTQGQLKALVDDIDQMQAVPLTDPQPVSIRVASSTPEGM